MTTISPTSIKRARQTPSEEIGVRRGCSVQPSGIVWVGECPYRRPFRQTHVPGPDRRREMSGHLCVLITPEFKVGSQPPTDLTDYLGWHEWARVQVKAKLKQRQCWKCGLWRFPQELCCGPKPLTDAGFTVNDVISGKVTLPKRKRR